MNRIVWRWEEKDFGFRFRMGKGRNSAEYYQATHPNTFYEVPANQRKLARVRVAELTALFSIPRSPDFRPNPWRDYHLDWDWIQTENGICLNYAGCLDREEIDRREDEGVARAMEFANRLIERPQPVSLNIELVNNIHRQLMAEIYPFAGNWRTVSLHRGDGPTRWPLPPCGIQPLMEELESNVFCRSPFISAGDNAVFAFASEVMSELLAIHPFREGNGRMAFILGNLILMQNDFLPLDVYHRRRDQERYYAACDQGRIHKNYQPLAELIAGWEDEALEKWETE